jgi:hypothetical protein
MTIKGEFLTMERQSQNSGTEKSRGKEIQWSGKAGFQGDTK